MKLNLCVVNLNDGGDLLLEDWEDISEEGRIIFEEDWNENDNVSLEDGLKELDDYFNDYGERSEEDKEEWVRLKSEFVNRIKDKKGKFYLWGIEYDWELMFIED